MSLLAEHVVNAHGATFEFGILDLEFRHAFLDEAAHGAGLADAAEIAFHICHEAGNTSLAEGFCKHLEGNGLAGTGGAGDESVAVGHLSANGDRAFI